MNNCCSNPGLDECNCCQDSINKEANRPGLPSVAYRPGTHAAFLRRMLGKIHTKDILRQQLTTRDQDDPAIAFLDSWAAVGDVLAFYEERIANEAYLRTATERRSILEMARTIGYELNPGVAAGAYLAFTLDEAAGPYLKAVIPAGTQVQSLPAKGELPQTFETSGEFVAHADWSRLTPRQTRPQTLALDEFGAIVVLARTDSGTQRFHDYYLVNPDDLLYSNDQVRADYVNVLYFKGIDTKLQAGDLLLFAGQKWPSRKVSVARIATVEIDKVGNRTIARFYENAATPGFNPPDPDPVTITPTGVSFSADEVKEHVLRTDVTERMLNVLLKVNNWDEKELLRQIAAVRAAPAALEYWQGVFAFREHVGFFGANAPVCSSLKKPNDGDLYDPNWDSTPFSIWKKYMKPIAPSTTPADYSATGADVYLERKIDNLPNTGWAVFEFFSSTSPEVYSYLVADTVEEAVTGFSLSARTTGLKLKTPNDTTPPNKPGNLLVRKTAANVKSERLELAPLPVVEPLKATTEDRKEVGVSQLMLDTMVIGLQKGQPVIVSGERTDAPGVTGVEVAFIKEIIHSWGYTVLTFQKALQFLYVRATVTINANVAAATHGETVKEVLGSGDGAATNQVFKLKKPPLTYVSAATARGSESTLTVKVNDVKWEEAPSLYGLDARDRNYIVRLDNEANTRITAGDGKQGARLPSGQENITAVYRSGIGSRGQVGPESLKLLTTRPPGVRAVTNPLAATGAQDPETMDKARANSPLTVLTMDRIVSLQDYEDFARGFAGIGKAQAVVLWNGSIDLVHVTVAGADGKPIDKSTSPVYRHLIDAINDSRNPAPVVMLDTFVLRLFQADAKLDIDPAYDAARVIPQAEAALAAAFSFEKRHFGQPVTAAEVISTLQQIPGVIYVDLDKLYVTDSVDPASGPGQTKPAPILTAHKARWPQGESLQLAQLLLIHPLGIKLKEIGS